MQNNEKLSKLLEEGEAVRWSGTPQPYGLFDETHKTSTMISLFWALFWGIILVGGYYASTVKSGQEIQKGVMFFCAIIPIAVAWSPIGDKNYIKKLLYAVTDKKVIVVSPETSNSFIMNIAGIDGVRVEKTKNGNCHIKVGSPVFKASAKKLLGLAIRGETDNEGNDKICKGLVFYNVSAEDGNAICGLLKPIVEVGQ